MAYESLLTVTPLTATLANYTFSSATSGVSAVIGLNISGTTLGSALADDDSKLYLQTAWAPSLGTLSATSANSVYLTLSSASVIPTTINYNANIVGATFNTANSSVTIAINFPANLDTDNVNLLNTVLYLSGNSTAINFDSTKQSALDNFFFASTNPGETSANSSNAVRTTFGHSRLVAARG